MPLFHRSSSRLAPQTRRANMRRARRATPVLAALVSLWLLAACGMKGPLYLPEPPPPTDEQLAQPPVNQELDLPPAIPEGSNPTSMPLS